MSDVISVTPSKNGQGVFLFIPWGDVHSVRVALRPESGSPNKSLQTAKTRETVDTALARADAERKAK